MPTIIDYEDTHFTTSVSYEETHFTTSIGYEESLLPTYVQQLTMKIHIKVCLQQFNKDTIIDNEETHFLQYLIMRLRIFLW